MTTRRSLQNFSWTLPLLAAALPMLWLARRKSFRFDGKTVLITGGSRGLGLALARRFLGEGANVVISGRDPEFLAQAARELSANSSNVHSVCGDVGVQEDAERMVKSAVDRFGALDVLVNNAGTIQVGPWDTMGIEDFHRAMKTHFWGPLYTIRAAIPHFRRQGGGRIVNISSVGGKISTPHLLPYSASKFALTGLSQGFRTELVRENVTVTTVCPGLMRTGSPRNALFKGKHREEYAWFSISDAMPGLSMNAKTAAARIVEACRAGRAEVVLGAPAKVAVRIDALFPNATASLLAAINEGLPSSPGVKTDSFRGKDSESALSPSVVTTLNERSARQNNQFSASEKRRRAA